MSGGSWSHRLVRPMVRPLVGTGVTPNHLTTLRLVTGLGACAALMVGSALWNGWGGILWILSLLLDYADGELARIGKMATPGGHRYDYVVDNLVTSLFFVAIGVGLRQSVLGEWTVLLGVLAGVSVYLCGVLAEALDRRLPAGDKALSGAFGFNPEDVLYLAAPLAWCDWLLPLLVGAAVGAPVAMAVIGLNLLRHRKSVTTDPSLPGVIVGAAKRQG